MARPSDVESELAAHQAQQEEEFEALQQQERLAQQQQQGTSLSQAATNLAKGYAKNAAKKVAKEEAVAAASAAGSAIVSTAPIWGPILGFFAVFFGIIFLVIISLVGTCNQSGLKGFLIRGVVNHLPGIPSDVCAAFQVGQGGQSGGGGGSATYSVSLDIAITSAYRAGAIVAGTNRPSAHGRGEAVDIALRNPIIPVHGSDPRIAQLVQLGMSAGFVPVVGDTLDEYTNPTEGATGGHVHIEFNTKPDGTTYCDGSTVKIPPKDLEAIPPWIPVDGASDPRVRPCMLTKVIGIFEAAGYQPK